MRYLWYTETGWQTEHQSIKPVAGANPGSGRRKGGGLHGPSSFPLSKLHHAMWWQDSLKIYMLLPISFSRLRWPQTRCHASLLPSVNVNVHAARSYLKCVAWNALSHLLVWQRGTFLLSKSEMKTCGACAVFISHYPRHLIYLIYNRCRCYIYCVLSH